MDRHYAMKLLREARLDPRSLTTRRKFWRVELFDLYLERCDELLFRTPAEGLELCLHAPLYATRVAGANPESISGPVLQLRALSHLGNAYRANEDYGSAEDLFRKARRHEAQAPAHVIADLYRRLAYLRIFQHDPEVFDLIGEAIAIHKRGNLVERHGLGECLLCRGHAFHEFELPGRSLEDWTAALSHLSMRRDPKPYYAALHNLAVWAAFFGTKRELARARANLEPALSLLSAHPRRHFARYKLRWLLALMEARLGHAGAAELGLLEARSGLERLKLPYEVGMVSIDLATLYLEQGKEEKLRHVAKRAIALFRKLGIEPHARKALELLNQIETPDAGPQLRRVRELLASAAEVMPATAA